MTTELQRLEYKIQRVLPTVYDDSLSFYELVNKVVQKLNEVIDSSNEYFSTDLSNYVENILDSWDTSGRLDTIINQSVFNRLNERIIESTGLNVKDYGAIGDGVADDSAAIQAAVDDLPAGGGVLIFPLGKYKFGNVVVPTGTFISLQGRTGRGSIFTPVNAAAKLFMVGGTATSGTLNTDFMHMSNIRVESAFNHDYDKALFDLKFIRNFVIEKVTGQLSGTGTLFRLDTSYVGMVKDSMIRTGRYMVGFDFTNITKPEEQQDTIKFENVTIFGNLGVVVRRSGGNYHTFRFDGLKILNLNADGDYGVFSESGLTADVNPQSTSVTVANGSNFPVGTPIIIGFGEFVEMNRVAGVSGNTLTLTKPLMFGHAATTERVLTTGVGVSLANPLNTLFTGCHFEGLAVGIMVDSVKGLTLDNVYTSTGELVRICGGSQDITVREATLDSYVARSKMVGVAIPSFNTSNVARLKIDKMIIIGTATAATITEGVGASVSYDTTQNNQGVPEKTYNVGSGLGATTYVERFNDGGAERFKRTYDGEMDWRNGQVIMDYLTGDTVGLRKGHFKVNGAWNDGLLVLGNMRLWVDTAGKLRYKMSAPTSDTDGTILGTQA